jgi:putative component of toxin-antitoxin plasmid stabilization module
MELYFNPYPGPAKNETDGIHCAVELAGALSRLKKELQSISLIGRFPEEQIEVKPSDFVLVRTSVTELRLKDILSKALPADRVKLQLLLHIFSRGQIIDTEVLNSVENWIITSIDTAAPILEIAAKNKAVALTIPTEDIWRNDVLSFQNRLETLHNLWGQTDITRIVEHCIDSLRNAGERFSMQFNAIYCPGSLNDAPNTAEWERYGYFSAMQKAKERAYQVDNNLIKNKDMPKTKKYGSLLELRIYAPGHRIFFVRRKGTFPEILIGGFYQKNESMSQNESIQNAKKRIDDYDDGDI